MPVDSSEKYLTKQILVSWMLLISFTAVILNVFDKNSKEKNHVKMSKHKIYYNYVFGTIICNKKFKEKWTYKTSSSKKTNT